LAGSLRRQSLDPLAGEAAVAKLAGSSVRRAYANIAKTESRYAPYAVDWRFLPAELLFIKDYIRHYLAEGSNYVAGTRYLSPIWANTIGMNLIRTIKSAEVLFIHIPKTGGTSISKVLYQRNLPHYTARFWVQTFGAVARSLPSFAVIRHPAERFVSTYKMAIAGGTDIVAYSQYWRSRLRGLESLDAFADHVLENSARPGALPRDLRLQSEFILDDEDRVMVDRLFSLDARLGLPEELGRWLSVPVMPHLNATAPTPLGVSAATREKIEQIYRRDFALYRHLVARGGAADVRGQHFDDLD
jgi:hypothetical protein